MACEVPVISSNTGGIPELNVQGETGFLSPVGDIEDMTRNALYILDKNNLPRFRQNALKRAQEFDITRILPLYESYYSKILEKTTAKTFD
jgi:glycosyltransferase involved in cell wall biosynthesis